MLELDKVAGIQSVERAVAVLDAVAIRADEGCKLADIVTDTQLGRATAHRFLKGLELLGLVEFDEWSGRFFPGIRLVAWGSAASNRFGLARRAAPSLRRLAERTSDTIYLTLRVGHEAICLAREEGAFPIKTLTLKIGDRRPLGVGAGPLAMLMCLQPPEIQQILDAGTAAAAAHGLDSATIREMLEASQRSGFALNDGRMMPGMAGIGLPICTSDGQAIAAISVAAISQRMEPARRANIVIWIREEVEQIEADLAPLLGPMAAGSRRTLLAKRQ